MRGLKILVGAIGGLIAFVVLGSIIASLFLALGDDDNPYTDGGDVGSALAVFALAVVVGPIVGGYLAARLTRSGDAERPSKDLW